MISGTAVECSTYQGSLYLSTQLILDVICLTKHKAKEGFKVIDKHLGAHGKDPKSCFIM